MRPQTAATLIAGILATSACAGTDHPEWGPYPPVAPMNLDLMPQQHIVVPLIFPVIGPTKWTNSFNDRRGTFRHSGIDIIAPKMSPIVAPFSGTLGMKRESFWIYGDNGWTTLGTHLNDDHFGKHDHKADMDLMFAPNLVPGMHVTAGQFIGYVGESGNATGPHLHFELYAPGEGTSMSRIRNPFYSLKMAQFLSKPRISIPDVSSLPEKGEIRWQGCVRKVDEKRNRVTLLLLAKQTHDGAVIPITKVRYMRIHLPPRVVEKAGDWTTLGTLGRNATVAAFVSSKSRPDEATAHRLVVTIPTGDASSAKTGF